MIVMYRPTIRAVTAVATGWWAPRLTWTTLATLGAFGAASLCVYRGQAAVGGILVVVSAGSLAGMLTWWLLGRQRPGQLAFRVRPTAPDEWLIVGSSRAGGTTVACSGCAEKLANIPAGAVVAGDNLITLWSRHRKSCPRRGLNPVRSAR